MHFVRLSAFALTFVTAAAFAEPKPIYQITADLYQNGKMISSSSLTTEAGTVAAIRSKDQSGTSDSLVLLPELPSPDGSSIEVQFKLFRKNGGDSLRKRDSVDIKVGEPSLVKIERVRSLGPYEIFFTAKRL